MTLRYVGWTCRGRANRLKDHLEGPEKSGAGMWAAFLKAAVDHKPDEILQHLHSRTILRRRPQRGNREHLRDVPHRRCVHTRLAHDLRDVVLVDVAGVEVLEDFIGLVFDGGF